MSVTRGRRFLVYAERKLREAAAAGNAPEARATFNEVLFTSGGDMVFAIAGAILIGIEQRRGCGTQLSRILGILITLRHQRAIELALHDAINGPNDQVVIGLAADAAVGLEYLLLAEGN